MKSAGLQIGLVIAILAGVIVVNDGLFVVRVDRFAIARNSGLRNGSWTSRGSISRFQRFRRRSRSTNGS